MAMIWALNKLGCRSSAGRLDRKPQISEHRGQRSAPHKPHNGHAMFCAFLGWIRIYTVCLQNKGGGHAGANSVGHRQGGIRGEI